MKKNQASDPEYQLKLQKLQLLKQRQKLESELPHLYGQKLYKWQREWLESTNTINLMNKGNQVGGSSIQIRKAIHWATDPAIRQRVFKKKPEEPLMFLYFMPALNLFTREFHTKWIPNFMPRGDAKTTGRYSWRAEYDEKKLEWINFIEFPEANTIIFTLGYGSDPHKSMQAMTPDAVFADEEMPEHIWGEIYARLSSHFSKGLGFFHMTCTPTRGEKMWDEAFNGARFPDAFKMNVRQYECLSFEDGSPGHHSLEGIKKFAQGLPDQREVDIRINGKFAKAEGLIFQSFDSAKNVGPRVDLGKNTSVFAGIDMGSGGQYGHPAAIAFVEVNEARNKAQLIKLWKGNNLEKTTATDVVNKFLELRANDPLTAGFYDHAASDIGVLSERQGLGLMKANKDVEGGYGLLNSLFKNQMLHIPDEPEFKELVKELDSMRVGIPKKNLKDDAADATRYALTLVPFDFNGVIFDPTYKPKEQVKVKRELARGEIEESYMMIDEIDQEIQDYNKFLEG